MESVGCVEKDESPITHKARVHAVSHEGLPFCILTRGALGELYGALRSNREMARAEIREVSRCQRSRDGVLKRDDQQAIQRQHQNDLGRPSTCSATYEKIRLVEIGAT